MKNKNETKTNDERRENIGPAAPTQGPEVVIPEQKLAVPEKKPEAAKVLYYCAIAGSLPKSFLTVGGVTFSRETQTMVPKPGDPESLILRHKADGAFAKLSADEVKDLTDAIAERRVFQMAGGQVRIGKVSEAVEGDGSSPLAKHLVLVPADKVSVVGGSPRTMAGTPPEGVLKTEPAATA